jgi:uncharacterized protein (DUF58 family)
MFHRIREFLRWFYHYRSIRLTPEGMRFVLLTLAVGVAAINTGNNLLYLLLAMLLSLIVISGMLSEQCIRHLEIQRLLPEHITANRPTTAALRIANRKPRLPTFSLRVMDVVAGTPIDRGIHVLHLPPNGSSLQSYPVLIAKRGRYRIEEIKLLTRFPFGLFLKATTLPLESETVVYPEPLALPEHLVQDLTVMGHEQTVSRRGPGADLYNLRAYQTGDDSRTIHWRTSARHAQLITKETEAEDQRRVTVALSTDIPPGGEDAFERAVSFTASLLALFHERGYAVGLVVGPDEHPARQGLLHLHRLLRALGLCEATPAQAHPIPPPLRNVGLRTGAGELTLLVLPCPDSRFPAACGAVSRVLRADEVP